MTRPSSSPVGWDDDPLVADWRGLPRLDGEVIADACVVGLGASGLAAVETLADRGLSVVGLDSGRVAAGAAGRNGGFLLGGTAAAIHDVQRSWGETAALDLYRRTLAELDDLADRLGPDIVRRVGSIRLAGLPGPATSAEEERDRELEMADCRRQREVLEAAGIDVESYSGSLGQGLFLPDDAAMNPARRALTLAAELVRSARLFEYSPVREIGPGSVSTGRGRVQCGIVIVAVDGRLEVLLPQLAPLVRTGRLQMLATAPGAPSRLPCPVYGRWGFDYGQQDDYGRLYVGGGRDRFEAAEWTTEDAPTEPVQTWIESVAARMLAAPVQVTHRWAASVGFTTDGRALCLPVEEGVLACGGYNGTGNLVGPVAARAAVALALDGTPPPPCFTSRLPDPIA